MTIDEQGDTPHTNQPNPRRVAANRINAQRSTGPRTRAGKTRVSQNAVRHGAYAGTVNALTVGVHREDPGTVSAMLAAISASLNPRDAVEQHQAWQVATAYLSIGRLDKFETALLDEAATMDPRFYYGPGKAHPADLEMLREILDVLLDDEVEGEAPIDPCWKNLAAVVKYRVFANKVRVVGLWDEQHTPASSDEWKTAFNSLIAKAFPEPGDALDWVSAQFTRECLNKQLTEEAETVVAAHRAMNALRANIDVRSRADKRLRSMLDIYCLLQKRDVDCPSETKP